MALGGIRQREGPGGEADFPVAKVKQMLRGHKAALTLSGQTLIPTGHGMFVPATAKGMPSRWNSWTATGNAAASKPRKSTPAGRCSTIFRATAAKSSRGEGKTSLTKKPCRSASSTAPASVRLSYSVTRPGVKNARKLLLPVIIERASSLRR